MPENFDLTYTNEQGESERIVMIHVAMAGSLERFLSVLIEHTAGKFPIWLAPEQLRIATVSGEDEGMIKLAQEIQSKAHDLGIRAEVDTDAQSVGKKIRESIKEKVPYTLVIGDEEVETGMLKPRVRADLKVGTEDVSLPIDYFFQSLANEAWSITLKSSM